MGIETATGPADTEAVEAGTTGARGGGEAAVIGDMLPVAVVAGRRGGPFLVNNSGRRHPGNRLATIPWGRIHLPLLLSFSHSRCVSNRLLIVVSSALRAVISAGHHRAGRGRLRDPSSPPRNCPRLPAGSELLHPAVGWLRIAQTGPSRASVVLPWPRSDLLRVFAVLDRSRSLLLLSIWLVPKGKHRGQPSHDR
jgi:hypothetical protein